MHRVEMDLLLRAGGDRVGLGWACSQVPLGPWIAPHLDSNAVHSGLKPWQTQALGPLQTCPRLARHGRLQESSSSG